MKNKPESDGKEMSFFPFLKAKRVSRLKDPIL